MKTTTVWCTLLALSAAPLLAGTKSCTAALVSAGLCRSTSEVLVCNSLPTTDPDGAGPRLSVASTALDAYALLYNWQASMTCLPEMASVSICTLGQPLTKSQFVDWRRRQEILEVVRRAERLRLLQAAEAAAIAASDPDIY